MKALIFGGLPTAPETLSNWLLVVIGGLGVYAALKTLRQIQRQTDNMNAQTGFVAESVGLARRSAEAAKASADAAKASADALINSERAWFMAELGWYEKTLVRVEDITVTKDGVTTTWNTVRMKLTCRNEGRTPGWIEEIRGFMEILHAGSFTDTIPEQEKLYGISTHRAAIGSGQSHECSVGFTCAGRRGKDDCFSVYVLVTYRDIFDRKRETSLGYSVIGKEAYRQFAPNRNRNT